MVATLVAISQRSVIRRRCRSLGSRCLSEQDFWRWLALHLRVASRNRTKAPGFTQRTGLHVAEVFERCRCFIFSWDAWPSLTKATQWLSFTDGPPSGTGTDFVP